VEQSNTDQVICQGWTSGKLLREIAAATELTVPSVSRRAKQIGLPPRAVRVSIEERDRFIRSYVEGASLRAIAARSGRDVGTVRTALRAAGVSLRGAAQTRTWPVHHGAFRPPLSPEALYWLGFLAADGSVRGSRIDLVQRNGCEDVLRRFLIFIGSGSRPLILSANRRAKHAVVSSPSIARDLATHGIVPRKSWSLRVSEEAASNAAFWLGMLDGDGCVHLSSGGVPKIIYLGTEAVMQQCAAFIATVLEGRRPAVNRVSKRPAVLRQVAVTTQALKGKGASSVRQQRTRVLGPGPGVRCVHGSATTVARGSNAIRRSCLHLTPSVAAGISANG
jgi:hypothetical protein